MDLSVITTYRCDSRCSMCHIWKNPTHPDYEIDIDTLRKLPGGFDYLNITGGEPTIRKDLIDICRTLRPKTRTLEISTNGLHPNVLEPIVREFPDIKIRISVEGFEATNNKIRGERDGFNRKVETMRRLIDAGGTDLGFATTFQDENIAEVVDLYRFSKGLNVEFATSALHNAFQFHKNDNVIYDRVRVAKQVESLITDMLRSWSVKTMFRAYMNLGLIAKILGQDRLYPCTQGTDSVFVDPWGDVYACNVRNDLLMGNLHKQTWDEIYHGDAATSVRQQVSVCPQNCWMVSSAKTAIRSRRDARLPKPGVVQWVAWNKLKVTLGKPIAFEKYIDYGDVRHDTEAPRRKSYLGVSEKKVLQPAESRRYTQLEKYFNR
ncbi:MAG: radical SAM/SPASM domain-containing protein [Solirubrobacteraceae bacterium]